MLAGLLLPAPVSTGAEPPRTHPDTSSRPLPTPAASRPGFRKLAPSETGIAFTNLLSEVAGAANRVLENGSGVAAGDFDADGWPDLFFCGLSGNSALYRNLGHGRFTEATQAAGLNLAQVVARGAVFADLDGDRRPDLLVSTLDRGVLCFLNDGGRFRDATADAGTAGPPGSTTLALADVDANGTPDLYVTRYRAEDIRDSSLVEVRRTGGRTELHPKYAGRLMLGPQGLTEFGEPDILYLNDGRGRFREVPWNSGRFLDESGQPLAAAPRDWGLTASFRDVNADGHPDLYVCNDYWTPDRFWLNTGDGRFRAAPATALRHTSENSMGVDFADLDLDGRIDFLVLDMLDPDPQIRRRQALAQTPMAPRPGDLSQRPQIMRNTLFRGRPDGSFAEIAEYAGVGRSGWSWQPLFLDVDLDGLEDVLMPSGHRRDVQDLDATERIRALQHPWPASMDPKVRQESFLRERVEHGRLYPPLQSPIVAFRNRGGFRFEPATADWGLETRAVHQGAALVDLDLDGDLDLVVNALNQEAGIYRNEASAPRVAVRLRGLAPNTDAIGAIVRCRGGAVPLQSREVVAGGRYLSGSDSQLTFAAGAGNAPLSLEVTWRSGRLTVVPEVAPGRWYEIRERDDLVRPSGTPPPAATRVWFEDRTRDLGHTHAENPPDEFALQPLLHRRLSQAGPGVAIADFNADGWDDLAIGASAGAHLGLFTNDTRGNLVALSPPPLKETEGLAPSHLAVTDTGDGPPRLLLGRTGGHPRLSTHGPAFLAVSLSGPAAPADTPAGPPGAALALGDLDGDGAPDLFLGGIPVPGRYPESTPSRIFRRHADAWRLDAANTATLAHLGTVHAAVWGDLDGDGDADLAVAAEWSPLRTFRNDAGHLVDVTRAWGLEPHSGWWTGLTLGDLDADGRLDLVAGNWGLNADVRATPERPAVLIYGDLLDRDSVDLLAGEWDPVRGTLHPARRLDELEPALPTLRHVFPTHQAFAAAPMDAVVRSFGHPVHRLEARTLASTVFLRRDAGFEAVPLPPEAQYAPVFSVLVSDFDGDGLDDLFLAQNCAALPWSTPRLDAGQGLILRGTGNGNLEPLGSGITGVRIEGDQRGAAVGDFDADGRADLIVTQNGATTRWLRNRHAAPGLRVRLRAGPNNPDGVGAVARVGGAGRQGPARPVLGGSGWGSFSSPVLVLGRPRWATSVTVRWPDGQTSEHPIPTGSSEIRIRKP